MIWPLNPKSGKENVAGCCDPVVGLLRFKSLIPNVVVDVVSVNGF